MRSFAQAGQLIGRDQGRLFTAATDYSHHFPIISDAVNTGRELLPREMSPVLVCG